MYIHNVINILVCLYGKLEWIDVPRYVIITFGIREQIVRVNDDDMRFIVYR